MFKLFYYSCDFLVQRWGHFNVLYLESKSCFLTSDVMLMMWLILLWQSAPVPPAPPLKAQTSPLANMFNHQDSNTNNVTPHTPTKNSIGNF